MAPNCTMEVGSDGVAVITLQNLPVNALHPDVLTALFQNLREAQASPRIRAIVLTGAGNNFSAGFDINLFATGGVLDDRVSGAFSELLEAGPKPSVAAVQGIALGGGCEAAMACNARVVAVGTKMGLPELSLGIIPGFGGTQRLPRLVGVQRAAEMMLTSKPISAQAAKAAGLVDEIVLKDTLLETARKYAVDIADGRRPRLISLHRTDHLEPLGEALAVLGFARAQVARQARNLTHPLLCLDAIQYGIEHGGAAGLDKETECFAKAASLDAHKGLVHIFFAQRSTKKVRGITDVGLKPRQMKVIAVLGGGLMGSGIATACALAGLTVLLKEINQKFLDGGLARIKANLASSVKKGRLTQEQAEVVAGRITGTLTYDDFKRVDMVIEAAIEDIPLKQRIFADLEAVCRPDAILSSNTSTIDISLIGKKTHAADRIVGAHFFSPAHIMPLLEIVRTKETSKQVVLDTLEFGSKIKKTPVLVDNCTGFAVNRVFFPYTQAACMLVDLGLDPYSIDKVIAGFGMPMGPFRLSDLVGADIGMHVGKNFINEWPERNYIAYVIKLLNDHKMLGEKSGKGFYTFDKKRKASLNSEMKPILEESQQLSGLMKAGLSFKDFGPQDTAEFIFFPVINEGCRVVEERIVEKPSDLDVASVLGMGFPPYRGGIIKYADLVGAKHIVARLKVWEQHFSPAGLGGFFKPCKYLEDCAASGAELSAGIQTTSRM